MRLTDAIVHHDGGQNRELTLLARRLGTLARHVSPRNIAGNRLAECGSMRDLLSPPGAALGALVLAASVAGLAGCARPIVLNPPVVAIDTLHAVEELGIAWR